MRSERYGVSGCRGFVAVVAIGAAVTMLPPSALNAGDQEPGELSVEVTFPGIENVYIVKEGDDHVVRIDEAGYLYVPGKPLLPLVTYTIALPPGGKVRSVDIVRSGETEYPGVYRIKPAPAVLPAIPGNAALTGKLREEWESNHHSVYSRDAAYPAFEGKTSGSGTLRKYSYVSVSVCPFSYRPLSGKLSSYSSARITVDYDVPASGSPAARVVEEEKRDILADERASRLFVNYDRVKKQYEPSCPGTGSSQTTFDYVILTDESLIDHVTGSSFYQWKTETGNSVVVLTVTSPLITSQPGRDLAEQIRNALRQYYMAWGVEHLLIVGDYEMVPMRYCFPDPDDHTFDISDPYSFIGEVPTDYYYADLSLPDGESWDSDGDGFYGEYGEDDPDFLADIYVGRIPTSLPFRVTHTLDKLVEFEQDTGQWKRQALQPGAILFFENQDYGGYPFVDGARLPDRIETDLMNGWTVSCYSEQDGLRTSDYGWPAISESAFITDWREGQYGVVNWSGHGGPHGVGRTIWQWDDGDGVAESHELWSPLLISCDSGLDDDYPSIVFAVSCLVGYPEPNPYGNLGVDLLTRRFWGAAAGVLSATRPAAVSGEWPEYPGGAESLSYEFNRYMICGPDGSEMLGNALYDGKFYSHQNYGWDHIYEYLNMYNYNLYGDPAMLREGVATPVVDDAGAGFVILDGSWQSMSHPDAHGSVFVYNPPGSGANAAAWRVDNIVTPGKYDVYIWKFDHPRSGLMATDAHYRVRDRNSMSELILVDLSTPGDEWIRLGSFEFDGSRLQGIRVTDEANGYVIADAVKLVYTGSLP